MLPKIASHPLYPSFALWYLKNGSGLFDRFFRGDFVRASTESHGKALRSQFYSTTVSKKISSPPKAKSQKPVPEKTSSMPPKKVNASQEAKTKKTSSAVHKKTRSPENIKAWTQFKGFKHNPRARFTKEFHRLAKHCKWGKDERKKQRILLFDAEFDAHFGSDATSLKSWQELCRLCTIDPALETIPECMNALESIFVNIHDVLNSQRTGKAVVPFENFDKFQHYTKKEGNTYPLAEAKADKRKKIFLKQLHGGPDQ